MRMTARTIIAVVCCGAVSNSLAQPIADDPDWELVRTIDFYRPWGVQFGPIDGLIYVGTRNSGDDGVHRIAEDDTSTKICDGDRLAAVFSDPTDGDIFFSEDYDGGVFRYTYPDGPVELWVTGFHGGDDDPTGMAVAPDNYVGPMLLPGDALVVDRGSTSADGVWAFSLDTPEGEWEVVPDASLLVDAVDIAISETEVYIADANGPIFKLVEGGTVVEFILSTPLVVPVGIALDPLTGDLFVVDSGTQSVVRIDTATGDVTPLFSGFGDSFDWAGVDVRSDGSDIVVIDRANDAIHVFTLCDVSIIPGDDCNGNGRRDICDIADGTSEDINGNGVPDDCECVGDLDDDDDVDQADLGILLAAYGLNDAGDIDGDGITGQSDLGILLVKYGTVCD